MKSETPGQTGGVSLGQSATCPHVRGRTTQWCALGQATAEAERALLRIGALFLSGTPEWEWVPVVDNAFKDETIMARARALLAETQEGPDVLR